MKKCLAYALISSLLASPCVGDEPDSFSVWSSNDWPKNSRDFAFQIVLIQMTFIYN